MSAEAVFVPHRECTKAGGDCFEQGRCLAACRSMARRDLAKRVAQLEREVGELRIRLIREIENRKPAGGEG